VDTKLTVWTPTTKSTGAPTPIDSPGRVHAPGRGGAHRTGVVRRLGAGENSPREWREASLAEGGHAPPGPGHPTPAGGETRRLRAEDARPRAGRDPLQRAAAHSARPAARAAWAGAGTTRRSGASSAR